jgi:aspartate aminotransferase
VAIRLAQRLQRIRPSATVTITSKAIALREQGRDVIGLSVGEPDFPTPVHIRQAAIEAVRAGETKYTAVDGTRLLKDAIARKFHRDNGLEYASEQIIVTSGAKQACFNVCQALLDPGDEAIIPAPYWVSYPDMVRLADAEPVIIPTTAESRFVVRPEQLAAAITPQTKLLILNSPSNPTGAVYSRADWEALGQVLDEHPRVSIMTDDIYEHLSWAQAPFTSIAQACPSLYERTITINGVSKCYAMSGWRVGYAAGPAPVIKAMVSLQSQSTTNACSVSQAAARAALDGDQTCVRRMRDTFKRRHDRVYEALVRIEGMSCWPGHGAFYLFPNVEAIMDARGIKSDTEFCERLLDTEGLALVPGQAFGGPGHVRLSFAAADAVLDDALARLARFVTR